MKCQSCNINITPDDIICPGCKKKTYCNTYRKKPHFYITIIISIIIVCSTTAFLIAGMNILYFILTILIAMSSMLWGLTSWLTKFYIDEEKITYYHPFKKSTTLKWDEIKEFTVYKESEKKKVFPRKIYTLRADKKQISFPEMKHTMVGYSRFMANIISKTKKYPREPEPENDIMAL